MVNSRLGIMLGMKLYYSFSEKNFDVAFSKLMVEINSKKKQFGVTSTSTPLPASPSPSSMQSEICLYIYCCIFTEEIAVPKQTSWKIDDVVHWLRQCDLQQCILNNVTH
jgi:hypothetical protein